MVASNSVIFDDNWLKAAATSSSDSWVNDVLETLDSTGQAYLSTLRLWFERFPLNARQKKRLRFSLESFENADHLGSVNELAWWEFMQREGIKGEPLPSTFKPRPDFQLEPPADCFIEVSTLNISSKDRAKFRDGHSVAFDDNETMRRVIGKLTDRKRRQLRYAAQNKKSAVLVLFDYTTSSGFGTQFFQALGDALLGTRFAFRNLPPELSAIIYLERLVLHGRIALSRQRSTIYYNPVALHSLHRGVFPSLTEFGCQSSSLESKSAEPWIWL